MILIMMNEHGHGKFMPCGQAVTALLSVRGMSKRFYALTLFCPAPAAGGFPGGGYLFFNQMIKKFG